MKSFTLILLLLVSQRILAQDRPNIILILTDDLGYTDLPAYGNPFQEAPNLDFLAKNGLKFNQAYSSSPVCSPSRAGLLTGIHSTRYHLTNFIAGNRNADSLSIDPANWNPFLEGSQETIAELLKTEKYTSAMIGKWHLGNQDDQTPWAQGFDFTRMIGKNGLDFYNYGIAEDSYDKIFEDDGSHYLTDKLTDYALEFLSQKDKTKPFFLFLSYSAPHVFIIPRGDKVSKYLKKYETFHGKYNPYYAAMIESVDDGIGQIRKKITQLGLDENTLIIFTSDNGGVGLPELGPTPTNLEPLRKWKGHPYEGGIKVPLLWYWKGKIQPGETDYQTTNLDLMPTFAFLLGLEENPAWDGENLVPILFGSREKKRETPLFWHYPHFSNQMGLPSSAVRKGDWKLVFHYEKHEAELYKISSDPSEKDNLVKSNPEKAEELFALLRTWLTDTQANLPILKSTGKPIELRTKLF